ncbi:hypothetical protein AURDEDRAFT_71149 [Auricularia subglabra TFB-10046 SS5]|nr:hypothetical protein AURDEDRAFT_71149 [Auricularia subglabra TFB-10046 SS5]
MHSLFDSDIPLVYRTFFLVVEPLSALAGAYYAYFAPSTYRAAARPDAAGAVALYQLANLYLLFCLNEHCVLSATQDRRVWRALLFGLLVADFGHLMSVWSLGAGWYWRVWDWNAMHFGGIGFVYAGATMRICYLLGLGLSDAQDGRRKVQ